MKLSTSIAFILSCGLIALGGCGKGHNTNASYPDIINGSTPPDNGLIEKSTVALSGFFGNVFCTGTLIDSQYVVSAAHCLAKHFGPLYVNFGRDGSEFTKVKASEWQAHPDFSGSFNQGEPSDISIIRLEKPAPEGYQPVEIYKNSLHKGEELFLAGFGQTESGSQGELLFVDVQVADTTNSEIVVSNGACYGDSGGPAYIREDGRLMLVGATSRGAAGCKGEAVYTNVLFFEAWLENWSSLEL